MPRTRALRPLLIAVWLSAVSLAAPADDALAALMKGQPDVAVRLLRGSRDAPGLSLLSRAYVGQSLFISSEGERHKLYAAAESAARAALAADTRSAEAHVELANALGLQLQGAGAVHAARTGLEIRTLFQQAVELDPAQARAWMGLGTWHAQALGLGALVKLATGANEATMRACHQRAITLVPNEVFFRLSYADSLLLLAKNDAPRAATLRREARGLLESALALTPQTFWQRYDQALVRERLQALP